MAVAVAASVTFGWSTAAMHNSAFTAPRHVEGLPSLLRHVVTDRLWLSGMMASLGGLVLHAFALSLGSIVIVQPIIATGLLWSFGFGELLQRRRPPRGMVLWAGLTAAGLAVFFTSDASTRGRPSPDSSEAAVVLAVGAALVTVGWLISRSGTRRRGGLALGGAAGVVFGLIAGTLKATAASHGVVDLVTSWPVYVLLLLGAVGFTLNQAAYNRVPLSQSLPILNVVNPVVALVFGYVAYQERPSGTALQETAQALGLVLTLLSVFMLARIEASEFSGHPLE